MGHSSISKGHSSTGHVANSQPTGMENDLMQSWMENAILDQATWRCVKTTGGHLSWYIKSTSSGDPLDPELVFRFLCTVWLGVLKVHGASAWILDSAGSSFSFPSIYIWFHQAISAYSSSNFLSRFGFFLSFVCSSF